MNMPTLADLNTEIDKQEPRHWGGLILTSSYAVGSYGYRASGTKTHVIAVETVVSVEDGHERQPGFVWIGDNLSTHPMCNSNSGQHSGRPNMKGDTDRVTCAKCLKWLGEN